MIATSPESPTLESAHLDPQNAQALLRLVEAAPEVRRRYQFYTWMQVQVQPLLPHSVALCGAYSRQRRTLMFEVFNSVVLGPGLLTQLSGTESALAQHAAARWIDGGGRPLCLALDAARCEAMGLREAGARRLLVHGVSRPERLHEVASLFVLAGAEDAGDSDIERRFELVVHALAATYQRALSFERDVGPTVAARTQLLAPPAPLRTPRITPREAQILAWVREGKSNLEIGVELSISALTVKNHIQKILRKLGASNRAHAVALAMQGRMLPDEGMAK
jgi:transcriptional regulator EpsA